MLPPKGMDVAKTPRHSHSGTMPQRRLTKDPYGVSPFISNSGYNSTEVLCTWVSSPKATSIKHTNRKYIFRSPLQSPVIVRPACKDGIFLQMSLAGSFLLAKSHFRRAYQWKTCFQKSFAEPGHHTPCLHNDGLCLQKYPADSFPSGHGSLLPAHAYIKMAMGPL